MAFSFFTPTNSDDIHEFNEVISNIGSYLCEHSTEVAVTALSFGIILAAGIGFLNYVSDKMIPKDFNTNTFRPNF